MLFITTCAIDAWASGDEMCAHWKYVFDCNDAYLGAASLQSLSAHRQRLLVGQAESLGLAVHVLNLQGRQLELVRGAIDNELDGLNL